MEKGRYCMLLEDDDDDQELFIDALHRLSATTGCYVAANGEEALLALEQLDSCPDYIFTDLNMPRMGGLEFLKIIRNTERFKHIPVIIYSSEFTEEHLIMAGRLGVVGCYRKTMAGMPGGMLRRYFTEVAHLRPS